MKDIVEEFHELDRASKIAWCMQHGKRCDDCDVDCDNNEKKGVIKDGQ